MPVLRGISFALRRGEILGLIGESGCGKSLTAAALVGLLPSGAQRISGQIRLDGEAADLTELSPSAWRRVRGRRVAMVFQEAGRSLNPSLTLGFQLAEVLRAHRGLPRRAVREAAVELLERVAMPDPVRRLASYPHQLSGGQSQRAQLAIALAGEPEVLLADEPTTSLDVTLQAQMLDLLDGLRRDFGLSILLITHDLGVVAQSCDRVAVMYAGRIVEKASVTTLFEHPAHPYTQALLAAFPRLGGGRRGVVRHPENSAAKEEG